MDVADWLRTLGLERYEATFRENGVNGEVLRHLTADDLKDLGVAAVGHRRQLLVAIAAFKDTPADSFNRSSTGPTGALGVSETTAERRPLSVMFCDLVGSTAFSSRLDPEDLREIIRTYQACVATTIQQFDGFIARYVGDGVLIYFGWPHARETDAERAVRAGLAVAAAVSAAPVSGEPLQVRIGIATGLVVIGEPIGSGDSRQQTAVGETPNLAARLQSLAGPNKVVIDSNTRQQIGGLFECRDLGSFELKGLPGMVPVWQVLGDGRLESRFEALRGAADLLPLIGREEELELLLRRWRQACAGECRVLLLRGEPGIGKSRLTAALREALAEVYEEVMLFCSPQNTDSPLRPVIAQLERATELAAGDAPEVRLAKLEALLAPFAPPAQDVALFAELLSVSSLGRWPSLDLSPQARRARLLEALARRIRSLAGRRPVLAVVEDAHWLDPTTRELLDLLVAEPANLALLMVVTYRPEFDPGGWLGLPHVTLLHLNRLNRAEHAALLIRVAGGKPLPAEVETEVLARTDGVPLFVEEVGRAVLESGLLREEADRWVVNGAIQRLAVPASLQASLVARLDRLSSAREVAQIGAVVGREFGYDLLAAVAGVPASALRSALYALAAADLVQCRGEPPDAVYAFRHALIRDAAYGTMLRERRRELHRRTADAIERLRPETLEREPEVLAQHRAEAGETEAAVALYQRAGERSAARAAFREARAHLARGTALLSDVGGEATARRLEAGLLAALGSVAMMDAGQASPEAHGAFARAVELSRVIGDELLLTRAAFGLWAHKQFAGDFAQALLLAEEGVRLARQQSAPDQLSRASAALGMTHFLRGRSDLARPLLEEVLADPNAYDAGAGMFLSGGVSAENILMWQLAVGGKLERAAAHTREAPERARGTQHPASLVTCLTQCCSVAWLIYPSVSLRDRARELTEVAEARGFSLYAARARVFQGWVAVEDGHVAEGIRFMTLGLAAQRAAGNALYLPFQEAMLADAQLIAGNADAALAQVEGALCISARTGEAWFEAELHRRVGSILLHLNRPDDIGRAESEFGRALAIARSQSALLFELRAACALARLRREQGRLAEARRLLAPVYQSFTEGFGFPDLVEARALLEELGVIEEMI